MFEEPEETPSERSAKPADRAREKSDELRMFAELAAVFEGARKFDAELRPGLSADLAREIQRGIGKLEKARPTDTALIPDASAPDAAGLLDFYSTWELSTNDYHIHRRPGEVMVVRWLAGDQVETFYERMQAHFDFALDGYKEDERQATEWKQDPESEAYLAALDKIEVKMAERYLREPIRKHNLFLLSTRTDDEINISYLCDQIMGLPPADLVGAKPAPPSEPTDRDLAWFFKLFSLRGIVGGQERMCFFGYLQKSDDDADW
jgi:hypothetical protein